MENDLLILSNSSEKILAGTLWLSDAAGKRWSQRVSLAARQTIRLNLHDLIAAARLSGQYGGIQIELPANAGALGSVHLRYDETAKSSDSLEMFSRLAQPPLQQFPSAASKQWTVYAPMLALRTPDPAVGLPSGTVLQPTVMVRNTTAKQVPANIALNWHSDSARGQVKLPPMELAPFATQQLQIGTMQKQLGIPEDAHWALVTLTTPSSPNDLVAIAASYDASGKYNLESPFSSNVAGHFAGGEWRADSTHNQIMAVTNTGQKTTNALLTLHYDNGEKNYEMQQTIQPGDQMFVNLASLIRNRVPDRKGNALPADASFGTYDLRDLTPGLGSLTEGNLTLDNTFGFNAKPPYPGCCGYSDPAWGIDDFDLGVDDVSLSPINGINSCTGNLDIITNDFTDWWSKNPAIATVTTGKVTGVAMGTTTASASGYVLENGCVTVPVQVNAPVTVQVPTSLVVKSVSTLSTGTGGNNGCTPTSNYGIEVDVKYQVLDQTAAPINDPTMVPHEHVVATGSGQTTDNDICPSRNSNCTHTTASDGTWHDVPYGACNGSAFSAGWTQTITIIWGGILYPVRTNAVTASSSSNGHGSITNGSDIEASR